MRYRSFLIYIRFVMSSDLPVWGFAKLSSGDMLHFMFETIKKFR